MKGGDPYSYPPRGLSREAAARYIGVSATKFDQLVADGRMPKPIRVDGRVIWDRIKLDMAFSELGEKRENTIDAIMRGSQSPQIGRATEMFAMIRPSVTSRFARVKGEKGTSGHLLPAAPGDPLDQWYARRGFDPATMNDDDMRRLEHEEYERWRSAFIYTPLGNREREALRHLEGVPIGQIVFVSEIKGCGSDTELRLRARGFIEPRYGPGNPRVAASHALTSDGAKAVKAILAGKDPAQPAR